MKRKGEYQAVLDSSAVLAYLQKEPGFERVQKALAKTAAISTVNLAEVFSKIVEKGLDLNNLANRLMALGLVSQEFTHMDAMIAARLYPRTKPLGLSLGDRACLALAQRLRLPAFTTDRDWSRLGLHFKVVVIR